jgi:rod shape-determining protein MreC
VKQNSPAKALAVLLIILFFVFIAGLKSRGISFYSVTNTIFVQPLGRVFRGMYHFKNAWEDTISSFESKKELAIENINLQRENAILNERLKILASVAEENERLKAALNVEKEKKLSFIPANVIGNSSGPYKFIILDKGSNQNIKQGDPVVFIDSNKSVLNLVGIVYDTGSNSTKVLLCNDPRFSVSVKDIRSGDIGIAQGEGYGLKIEFKLIKPKMNIDDIVETTSLSNIYPEGIIVGKVSHIDEKGPYEATVYITPVVDLQRLIQVFVISK